MSESTSYHLEICGWDGCQSLATHLYEITDSFGRVYQKTACEKCAKVWYKYRPSVKVVKDLRSYVEKRKR